MAHMYKERMCETYQEVAQRNKGSEYERIITEENTGKELEESYYCYQGLTSQKAWSHFCKDCCQIKDKTIVLNRNSGDGRVELTS